MDDRILHIAEIMGGKAMFDLNDAIQQWRGRLGEACGRSDLEELETHLLEEMEALRASGLSEQEAFWVGTHRLGDPQSLVKEYAKINTLVRWKPRIFWMAAGVLGYFILNSFSVATGKLLACALLFTGLNGTMLGIADCLGMFFLLGGAFYLLYLSAKHGWFQKSFSNIVKSNKGRILFFTAMILVFNLIRLVAPAANWLMQTRLLTPSEYGNNVIISIIVYPIFWSLVLPILLIIIMFKCHDRRKRSVVT
jgi:hypothetical protein